MLCRILCRQGPIFRESYSEDWKHSGKSGTRYRIMPLIFPNSSGNNFVLFFFAFSPFVRSSSVHPET